MVMNICKQNSSYNEHCIYKQISGDFVPDSLGNHTVRQRYINIVNLKSCLIALLTFKTSDSVWAPLNTNLRTKKIWC